MTWNLSQYGRNKIRNAYERVTIIKKQKSRQLNNKISNYVLPFIRTEKSSILQRVKYFIYIKELYIQLKDKYNLCKKNYKNKEVIGDIDNNKYIILDKRIGSESVYGEVYLAHFYKKLGSIAIKISSYSLNNFRKEIEILKKLTTEVITFKCPHFPIIYGSINCNFNKENKNEIMVLNELANGDFYSFYKEYSYNDDLIFNAIGQIILSLLFFYQTTKFFHNDTHGGNFLYHKIKPGGYFYYKLYGKDYYLKNLGFLWVCWDFGLSIKINKINKKNIYHDIRKILNVAKHINDDIKYIKTESVSEIRKIKDKKKVNILLERKKYVSNMIYSDTINKSLTNIISTLDNNYTGRDILLLNDLSLYLIEQAFKYIPSFTNDKPTNIINKNPYILNKFTLNKDISQPIAKPKPAKQVRPASPILDDISNDISPPIAKAKPKKECPEGKIINPKTGRCIKIKEVKEVKEVKEGQKKRGRPKKIITEIKEVIPEDKEPERSLKKLLPNISVSFFYKVKPLVDEIKDSNYSIDHKIVKIKELLTDLNDIYEYGNDVMSEAKQATIKYKYKKFIDYTLDRIKKVDEYYKQLLELKFKKK
jgi:hypothetical protein